MADERPNNPYFFPLTRLPTELLLAIVSHLNDYDLNNLLGVEPIRRLIGNDFALYTDTEETHFPNFSVVFRRQQENLAAAKSTQRTRVVLEMAQADQPGGPYIPSITKAAVETRVHLYPDSNSYHNGMFGNMINFGMVHAANLSNFNPLINDVSIENMPTMDLLHRKLNPEKMLRFPDTVIMGIGYCKVSENNNDHWKKLYTPKLQKLVVTAHFDKIKDMVDFESPVLRSLTLVNIEDMVVLENTNFPFIDMLQVNVGVGGQNSSIRSWNNLSFASLTELEIPGSLDSFSKMSLPVLKSLSIVSDAESFVFTQVEAPLLGTLKLNVNRLHDFNRNHFPRLITFELGPQAYVENNNHGHLDFMSIQHVTRFITGKCYSPFSCIPFLSFLSMEAESLSDIPFDLALHVEIRGVSETVDYRLFSNSRLYQSLTIKESPAVMDISKILAAKPTLKELELYDGSMMCSGAPVDAKNLTKLVLVSHATTSTLTVVAARYFPNVTEFAVSNPGTEPISQTVGLPRLEKLKIVLYQDQESVDVSGFPNLKTLEIQTRSTPIKLIKSKGCTALESVIQTTVGTQ